MLRTADHGPRQPFPPRHNSRGDSPMKAIVVTDQAAGTAGMKLVERPEPQAAINDVVVRVHASGFVGTELAWPSTWTDRLGRARAPSIPGHELDGVVAALGAARPSPSLPFLWLALGPLCDLVLYPCAGYSGERPDDRHQSSSGSNQA